MSAENIQKVGGALFVIGAFSAAVEELTGESTWSLNDGLWVLGLVAYGAWWAYEN